MPTMSWSGSLRLSSNDDATRDPAIGWCDAKGRRAIAEYLATGAKSFAGNPRSDPFRGGLRDHTLIGIQLERATKAKCADRPTLRLSESSSSARPTHENPSNRLIPDSFQPSTVVGHFGPDLAAAPRERRCPWRNGSSRCSSVA